MLSLALAALLACATHDVTDADAGAGAATATTATQAPPAENPATSATEDPPGTPGPVSDDSVEIPGLDEDDAVAADVEDAAPEDAAPEDAAPEDAAPEDAAPAAAGSAQGCLADADCGADMLCEGQGCGDDQPGSCVPTVRACTKDLRPYCGCDDKTFLSSGSCPGRRYQAAMPCPGDPGPTTPGGAR